ncbi:MAG TPA: MurR/RpiR family transcriptional regulator [Segeticoccus sp.]|uniref:MurR/RpiR family transcriptional regulator n=1 Tax=Segeticoccus sp. TaxID=2706531 RepID=UPI002D7E3FB3|nr:MurR/RpiR family transcriptional regulator [Segeticoccus sp.]HET8602015.1 MurR/RpiR family transcriptional regulator [Segeticoccus sp.]
MPPDNPATVGQLIRARLPFLPPAERRVAVSLLGGDPLLGLGTVADVAAAADTSAPTVLRLLARLGFPAFADYQAAVRRELSGRLSSPLEQFPTHSSDSAPAVMLQSLAGSVSEDATRLPSGDLDLAVRLLADERRRVLTLGGRFSRFLAGYLAAHLQLLRPGVSWVDASAQERAAALLDVDRRSVVAVFDFRRYQRDTVDFGAAAAAQRAHLLLFTDQYLSPLAAQADVVLPTNVESPSPFDVLTPAMALVEVLVAGVVARLGRRPRERMARYDELSRDAVAVQRALAPPPDAEEANG